MEKNTWADNHVAMLKGQKSMTEQQELIVLLYDKANRTGEESKQLDVLLKAAKAAERAKLAAKDAADLIGARKEAERKARNHRLIQQGLLIDFAELDGWSRGEILGVLLAVKQQASEDRRAAWKREGDALLAMKEVKNG